MIKFKFSNGKTKKSLSLVCCLFTLVCGGCGAVSRPASLPGLPNPDKTARVLSKQAQDLNPKVIKLALNAYDKARSEGYDQKEVLTVIDYSRPSNQRRLWVFDLRNERLLFNELVSHGRNSGDVVASSFSNQPNSLKTSIGVYATGSTYAGEHGYSLRLTGLEPGFNNNVYNRAIVMHGAWYVNTQYARQHGAIGRSWGCPAIDPQVVRPVIDTISHGTVLVAYYPDRAWLNSSSYLRDTRWA
ncbi:MAG: murein L,D-transpeptidase catalytic domain family protein [Gammaproteobacteria bacterium]|nr:murein L,D-transpeptidase catalytic domain family protein [Gammaproteobacteria bacterium]